MIFENVTGIDDVNVLGRKIKKLFSKPFQLGEHSIQTTASIGISLYPQDGKDFKSLMQTADIAMYYAKEKRDCFRLYTDCVEKA